MWWVAGAFVFWTLLGLVAALVLGKAIHREDEEEEQ